MYMCVLNGHTRGIHCECVHLVHACIVLNCSVFLKQDMRTALYYASKDGHVEVVEELLKAGAYVDYYDTVHCMTLVDISNCAIIQSFSSSCTCRTV